MIKKINLSFNGKNISIKTKECNLLQKGIGLMFSRRENAENLLFAFKKKTNISIHSFFVFFPFIALWLDEGNKFVDLKIVKPFLPCISPSRKCKYLIEIPFNKKNRNIIRKIFPTTNI